MALLASKGTPAEVAKLNRALRHALATKDVQDTLLGAGLLTDSTSPEALPSFITSESARWRKVIADSGIKID